MNRHLVIGGLALVLVAPAGLEGQSRAEREQERERERAERERRTEELLDRARRGGAFAYTLSLSDRERPRIGVTTESSGVRDTLGLLVSDVTEDGPADKAGLKEGDRIQSVNGVNLRLAPEDAGEDDMEGIATRRLIRTLGKAKIGDEVDLRVWSDGAVKNVRVKTVSVEDLMGESRIWRTTVRGEDRASLGIGVGSSGSRRDTLGILIATIADEGPAAKAGLLEGDRIQSINGVDLRVPSEDAGDWAISSSRLRRLTRELEKVKVGDEVDLRVYSGGSVKSVRLKTVASSDLRESMGAGFFFDGPRTMVIPRGQMSPMRAPMPGVMTFPRVAPDIRHRIRPMDDFDAPLLKQRIEELMPKIAPGRLRRRSVSI
jgi:hypothetical protein